LDRAAIVLVGVDEVHKCSLPALAKLRRLRSAVVLKLVCRR
jgi:hypothetical protein